MIVLNKNVLILKQKHEYSGLIQGVDTEESTYAKVMGLGKQVEEVKLGQTVILDWSKAKKVKNELFIVLEEDIVAILEAEELEVI